MDTMSAKDWEKFFELVTKIVEAKQPVADKTAAVAEQSRQAGEEAASNFHEFVSWDFSTYME